MIVWMTVALAATPTSVDLGAGSMPVEVGDYEVRVGKQTLDCPGEPCEIEVVDIDRSDGHKELLLCGRGPRDERACLLFWRKGKVLAQVEMPEGQWIPQLKTTGGGFALVIDDYRQRLYTRIDKYTYADGKLTRVDQPVCSAGKTVTMHIDRTFKLLGKPGSDTVIANTRPDSDITVLGEHGSKDGWMLVRLSSGITGWVKVTTLAESSDAFMQIMGAG